MLPMSGKQLVEPRVPLGASAHAGRKCETAAQRTRITSQLFDGFRYEEAFSRNLGWLTEWEQQALRGKRVAIAGMGGVGGGYLMTLVRFGVGMFTIADPDRFELVNFNRQVGATLSSIGRPKVEVVAENAFNINPEAHIRSFPEPIDESNIDSFLAGADLWIDGLDFFALSIRRKVYRRCAELGIPVINAAPLGMGVAMLVFKPGGMTFEQWFRLEGLSEEHQYINYLLGMAPSRLHMSNLIDPSRVDLRGHRGPSTIAGCELCAAMASVEAIKLLLGRGTVCAVPCYQHFDAFSGRRVVGKLRRGNASLTQRAKIAIGRIYFAKLSDKAASEYEVPTAAREIEKILDYARWAPSGDNVQPWRFEIFNDDEAVVHIRCPGDVYDYRDGEPTLLSGGMLLESMRIAGSYWGRSLEWTYDGRNEDQIHRIRVLLPRTKDTAVDPLFSYVPTRSVDRRPYRLRALTASQKSALAEALGPEFEIEWHEGWRRRWRLARLGAMATAIRLSIPEAFAVHQRIIDWDRQYSPDRIPAAAAGMSRASLGPMRWAMQSWPRMRLLNASGGLFSAQVQMDYLPGMCSAAFFTIRMRAPAPEGQSRPPHLLHTGMAIQRFWLTATRLGLAMQPMLAPLCFAWYARSGTPFTRSEKADRTARKLAAKLEHASGVAGNRGLFLGRIGEPQVLARRARSVRCSINDLLLKTPGTV
jgi:sulfur-carrier protein adenylyltransferase/sulfurtransferase